MDAPGGAIAVGLTVLPGNGGYGAYLHNIFT